MSLTPDAEMLDWQQAATRVLGELLTTAQRDGLPALTWQISIAGVLSGTCTATEPSDRRREWEQWSAALGAAHTWTERMSGADVTRLLAKTIVVADGTVAVLVIADRPVRRLGR